MSYLKKHLPRLAAAYEHRADQVRAQLADTSMPLRGDMQTAAAREVANVAAYLALTDSDGADIDLLLRDRGMCG